MAPMDTFNEINDLPSECRAAVDEMKLGMEMFEKHDRDASGKLDRGEVREALGEIFDRDDDEIEMEHVEKVIDEFDKDGDGQIDLWEFKTMLKYLQQGTDMGRSVVMEDIMLQLDVVPSEQFLHGITEEDSDEDFCAEAERESRAMSTAKRITRASSRASEGRRMSVMINNAVRKSKRDSTAMLTDISTKIYPVRDILCVQDEAATSVVNLDKIMHESSIEFNEGVDGMDQDFESHFPPSAMRCLALVSHNEMKTTMREFVTANRNLLKKFRLTGTNSTMTMLKEVFQDEPPGTVLFGPACASGPLGGDAELVSLMVSGRIGGILFFQDPMNAHPHRADIDCLVRQALVHNTMMAETPTSALMLTHCLRQALAEGKPEMIPSFFFSLQCPSVAAYKAQQKQVVDQQKAEARISLAVRPRGVL